MQESNAKIASFHQQKTKNINESLPFQKPEKNIKNVAPSMKIGSLLLVQNALSLIFLYAITAWKEK